MLKFIFLPLTKATAIAEALSSLKGVNYRQY